MGNQPINSEANIYNEEVPNSQRKGFSPIFRQKGLKEFVESPAFSLTTIKDVLKHIKSKYGSRNGIGEIIVSKQNNQNGQEVQERTLRMHSYNQVYDTANNLGRSIFAKHLFFEQPIKRMKLIGIYSKNRYEWFVSDWACVLFGITTVPLYDTLGIENLAYCLNQTQMTSLFVSAASIKTFLGLKDIGKVKNLISFDPLDEQTLKAIKSRGLLCLLYSQLIEEGRKLTNLKEELIPVNKEDCYTFSYTSGTTGPPKGAMISHRNMLAGITSIFVHKDGGFNAEDRYVSYLPLPHLLQRIFSLVMFYSGANVVISSGNTLKLKDDCEVVKPTVFLSVPRIFNRIAEAVKNKFEKTTGVKKCLIDNAVQTKMKSVHQTGQYTHCFYDSLIFSKVKEGFGGCIRILCTGSAPISPEVQSFLKAVMACPFIEGYGQTQSSGCALLNRALDTNYGTLCEISSGLELKLCDIPEMKYTYKDVDQNGKAMPRGEIWVRGPLVFMGYYKLPELTREAVNEEGWLKTGDVAQYIPECRSFRIIDRRKNIFKLQQGEYLAPDRIENMYMKSKLISEIFLHGDSQQHFAVAIVTPNREELQALADHKGIKGTYAELCSNRQIRKLVLIEINEVGKKQGLQGFELAKNIYLEENNFQTRGILTNTMKLIRYEARLSYKDQIKALYEEGELSK